MPAELFLLVKSLALIKQHVLREPLKAEEAKLLTSRVRGSGSRVPSGAKGLAHHARDPEDAPTVRG